MNWKTIIVANEMREVPLFDSVGDASRMPIAPIEVHKVEKWARQIDVKSKGLLYGVAPAQLAFPGTPNHLLMLLIEPFELP